VRSPFYIDLRRTVSDPVFLKLIAQAYVRISRDLDFDRIAGIPVAALPLATAVSLETGVPMIYPRIPQKQHGTGNRIEGDYRPGERVLLLDDLITTGLSKLEAVEVLRSEGLEVNDLAVLIERGGRGRADMAKVDIHLHAFAHVIDLFSTCREMGVIDEAEELRMRKFVEEGN
jgi:uridine monophosphate synthetase